MVEADASDEFGLARRVRDGLAPTAALCHGTLHRRCMANCLNVVAVRADDKRSVEGLNLLATRGFKRQVKMRRLTRRRNAGLKPCALQRMGMGDGKLLLHLGHMPMIADAIG